MSWKWDYCPTCGLRNTKSVKTCPECGTKIIKQTWANYSEKAFWFSVIMLFNWIGVIAGLIVVIYYGLLFLDIDNFSFVIFLVAVTPFVMFSLWLINELGKHNKTARQIYSFIVVCSLLGTFFGYDYLISNYASYAILVEIMILNILIRNKKTVMLFEKPIIRKVALGTGKKTNTFPENSTELPSRILVRTRTLTIIALINWLVIIFVGLMTIIFFLAYWFEDNTEVVNYVFILFPLFVILVWIVNGLMNYKDLVRKVYSVLLLTALTGYALFFYDPNEIVSCFPLIIGLLIVYGLVLHRKTVNLFKYELIFDLIIEEEKKVKETNYREPSSRDRIRTDMNRDTQISALSTDVNIDISRNR